MDLDGLNLIETMPSFAHFVRSSRSNAFTSNHNENYNVDTITGRLFTEDSFQNISRDTSEKVKIIFIGSERSTSEVDNFLTTYYDILNESNINYLHISIDNFPAHYDFMELIQDGHFPQLKCIVFLGYSLAQDWLPIDIYKDLKKTKLYKLKLDDYNLKSIYLKMVKNPIIHIRYQEGTTQGEDLSSEYFNMMQDIDRILDNKIEHTVTNITTNIIECKNEKTISDCLNYFKTRSYVCLDTEHNMDKENPDLCSIFKPDVKLLSCSFTGFDNETPDSKIEDLLKSDIKTSFVFPARFLTPETLRTLTKNKIIGQVNIKHDINVLELKVGILLEPKGLFDPMLYSYCLDQSKFGNGLKAQLKDRLGVEDWSKPVWQYLDELEVARKKECKPKKKIIKKQRELSNLVLSPSGILQKAVEDYTEELIINIPYIKPNFSDLPKEMLIEYNGLDTIHCMRLYQHLLSMYREPESYQHLIRSIPLLKTIEQNGLPIKEDVLETLINMLKSNIESNTEILHSFSIIQDIMRLENATPGIKEGKPTSGDFLGLVAQYTEVGPFTFTDSGKIKTDKDCVLKFIERDKTGIWAYINQIRKDSSMLSKYLVPIKDKIVNGKLHTEFIMNKVQSEFDKDSSGGTISGRLASSPNIQNLKNDPLFLMMIQAPQDFVLFKPDYPQIELRLLAEFSGATGFTNDFKTGKDPHKTTAKEAYGTSEISYMQRQSGKKGNFLVIYRGQAKLLYEKLTTYVEGQEKFTGTLMDCQNIIEAIHKNNPEIVKYWESELRKCRENGYVKTDFGRVTGYNLTGDSYKEYHIENQVCNNRIQGDASDITLQKSVEVFNWCKEKNLLSVVKQINIVHDSPWYLIHKDYLYTIDNILAILSDKSTLPFKMDLDITIDKFAIGYNLAYTKEVKTIEEAIEFLNSDEAVIL